MQLSELAHELLGKDVAPSGDHLAEFDESRAQFLERLAQTPRIALRGGGVPRALFRAESEAHGVVGQSFPDGHLGDHPQPGELAACICCLGGREGAHELQHYRFIWQFVPASSGSGEVPYQILRHRLNTADHAALVVRLFEGSFHLAADVFPFPGTH